MAENRPDFNKVKELSTMAGLYISCDRIYLLSSERNENLIKFHKTYLVESDPLTLQKEIVFVKGCKIFCVSFKNFLLLV